MPLTCAIEDCERLAIKRGWCQTHYERWRLHGTTDLLPRTGPTTEERFWSKIAIGTDGCWLWTGGLFHNGYGCFYETPTQGRGAHCYAYELFRGPVPDGLELDHLCRVRRCVNPVHLEAVTHAENMRRGWRAQRTHCKNGHEFTPENTRLAPNGRTRVCRACQAVRLAEFHKRKAASCP